MVVTPKDKSHETPRNRVQQAMPSSIEGEPTKFLLNGFTCAPRYGFLKFLEFIVCHRGIEVNPAKIEVFIELPPLKNIREPKELQD